MERTNEDAIALIDLGAASVETKGLGQDKIEPVGLFDANGLSNED